MIELELDILWNTEQSKDLHKLGIDVSPDMLTTKKVTFYYISAIEENDAFENYNFTTIYTESDFFISTLPYKKIKKLISEQLQRANDIHNNNRGQDKSS